MTTESADAPVQPLTHLTEDERLLRDSVREFAEAQIRPLVREMDEHAKIAPGLLPRLFDLGIMGVEIPETYGGAGGTFFHSVLVVEELSRVDPSIGVLVDVQNTLVINAILRWATAEMKARLLPRLASKVVGAYALSEAGSGSDAFALQTRARDEGDHWVLSGQKLWITNGNEADVFIVFATINPEAGYKGITAFIVERGMPGFTVGKKEDKLGIRASSTCELLLSDCKVPKTNVLGEVGKGYKVAIETLNEGRIGIGAQMLGLAAGALGHAIRYTKERKQFGKAIADFQGVQFQLARAATDVEASRLLVYNAARQNVPDRSGDVQDLRIGSCGAGGVARDQSLRRLRLREGLPRREALPGCEDRTDLRGDVQPAVADDSQEYSQLRAASYRSYRLITTRECSPQ
jgi:alkylation response protein AidB-like acyl-CoA dehydrogenase